MTFSRSEPNPHRTRTSARAESLVQTHAQPLPAGDEPPKELRLFRKGENTSVKGDFLFDDRASKNVMGAAKQWGNRYCFDLDHLMLEPNPQDAHGAREALGWYDLELRDGELWAVNIEWTADTAAKIREKKLGYFSPAFVRDVEKKTGVVRPLALINCAVTNLPAMDSIDPVASLSAGDTREEMVSLLRGVFQLPVTSEEAEALKSLDDLEAMLADPAKADAEGIKVGDLLNSLRWALRLPIMTSGTDVIAEIRKALGATHSQTSTTTETAARASRLSRSNQMDKAACKNAIHSANKKMLGAAYDEKSLESKLDSMSEEDLNKLAEGLPKDTAANASAAEGQGTPAKKPVEPDADDAPAANASHSRVAASIKKLFGTDDPEEIEGALVALSRTATRLDALEQRVNKKAEADTASERVELLSRATKAGILSPAETNEPWVKEMSNAALKSFVARSAARVRTVEQGATLPGANAQVDAHSVSVDGRVVTFSQDDEKMMSAAGIKTKEQRETFARNKISHLPPE